MLTVWPSQFTFITIKLSLVTSSMQEVITKCVLRNDSEIIHLNGIVLFTIEEVEEDSLEKGEASEDTFNNYINTNALKHK